MLAQRAMQFRAIQRRLLTRFKDKTPAPLANLDTLMEGTYRQVNIVKICLIDHTKSYGIVWIAKLQVLLGMLSQCIIHGFFSEQQGSFWVAKMRDSFII